MHGTPFFAKLVTFVLLTLSGHFLVEHWIQQNVEPVTSAVVYQAAGRLKSANSVPVAVLDISQFYEEKVLRGGQPDRPLDTDEFGEILGLFEQMSAKGHKPLAIGFDIDFSSSETELDRKLHKECIELASAFQLKTGIKVFLGVGQGIQPNPEGWLAPGHSAMAAAIVLQSDLSYQPLWYGPSNGKRGEVLPTLGVALGRALFEEEHANPRNASESLITARIKLRSAPGMLEKLEGTNWDSVDSFLVDYEPIRFRKDITFMFDRGLAGLGQPALQEVFWPQFSGKAVLVGLALGPESVGDWTRWQAEAAALGGTQKPKPSVGTPTQNDTFIVQASGFPISEASNGRSEVVHGIYAHASAAYSFALRPLKQMSGFLINVVTFLISLALFCIHVAHGAEFKREPEPTSKVKLFVWLERGAVWLGRIFVSIIAFPVWIGGAFAWVRERKKRAEAATGPFKISEIESHSDAWRDFETALATVAYPSLAILLAMQLAKQGVLWLGFAGAILYVLGEAFVEPLIVGLFAVIASSFGAMRGKKAK